MSLYYEHSGKVPIVGFILAALSGMLTAIILGVLYSYADVYIPFVYFNALLAAGLGMAIGAAVGWGAEFGHVRSRFSVGAAGFIAGLIGLYVAWGADLLARIGLPHNTSFLSAFRPDVLKAYIQLFYEKGFWAIGQNIGNNNNNGAMLSGIPLAIFWFAEAAVIIGLATWLPRLWLTDLVYCERCERWAKNIKNVQRLTLGTPDATIAQIATGDVTPLDGLPRAKSSDPGYLQLNLSSCDGCSDTNYLSIVRVINQIDKKGKPKQSVKALVSRLAIKAADVPRVREAGRLSLGESAV
jgi:hypothetical protein